MDPQHLELLTFLIHILSQLRVSTATSLEDCCSFLRYPVHSLSPTVAEPHKIQVRSINVPSELLKTCRKACLEQASCALFSLNYGESFCQLYRSGWFNIDVFLNNWLIKDKNSTVFVKKCSGSGISRGCSPMWAMDLVPGLSISLDHAQTVLSLGGLDNCITRCLSLEGTECRSAVYRTQTGQCYVSKYDRRTSPRAFIQAGLGREAGYVYAERKNVNETFMDCKFKPLPPTTALLTVHEYPSASQKQCQSKCLDDDQLPKCRSYRYDPIARVCALSPDDHVSAPLSDKYHDNVDTFYEVDNCVRVRVICENHQVRATFDANQEMSGKLYSPSNPECTFLLQNDLSVSVSIPTQPRARCGVEEQPNDEISVTMILQYHSHLMTARDRVFKFVCAYTSPLQEVKQEVQLRDIRTDNTAPNPVIDQGNLPRANMRIVNGRGQLVSTAEVGQELYAEVFLDSSSRKSRDLALFVTDCAAVEKGKFIKLVDSKGCPVDRTIFEGFTAVSPHTLRAAFQGFSFEHSQRININCNVNFCYKVCQPAQCEDTKGVQYESYGRKRRALWKGSPRLGIGPVHVTASLFMQEPVENFIRASIPHAGNATMLLHDSSNTVNDEDSSVGQTKELTDSLQSGGSRKTSNMLLAPLLVLMALLTVVGLGLVLWHGVVVHRKRRQQYLSDSSSVSSTSS